MNKIDRILEGTKTLKAAAEKVFELATKVGYPMANAKRWVQMYKYGTQDPTALLNKVKEYEREQTRLWLDSKSPLDMINEAIANTQAEIEAWCHEVKLNPYYHFRWADSAVINAAKWEVYHTIKRALEHGASWDNIMASITDDALQIASQSSRSTSIMSNATEDAKGAVLVRIVRGWDSDIRDIAYWFKQKAKYDSGE